MVSDKPSLEIDNLGEYLRAQRMAQRVSVEELSMRTRIAGRFIEALEGNRFDLLPNPVSARGFLRSYARALTLPEEPILRRHGELIKPPEPPAPDSQDDQIKNLIRPAPAIELISRAMRLWIPLGLFGAVVLLLWMVSRGNLERAGDPAGGTAQTEAEESARSGSENRSSPPQGVEEAGAPLQPSEPVNRPAPLTVEPPETPGPVPQTPSAPRPPSQVPPFSPPSVAISSSPGSEGPLVLVVEAVEPSWLEVVIDSGSVREALLQPGDKVRWEAKDRFLLNLGNAGGVNVSYNGKALDPFGPSGKVIKGIELSR